MILSLKRRAAPYAVLYALHLGCITESLAESKCLRDMRLRPVVTNDVTQGLFETKQNVFVLVEGGALGDAGQGELSSPSFFMSKYEVSYSEWTNIHSQALHYKYSFDNDGIGAGANYPVVNVSWYDCVKWCNLCSETKGRRPVYLSDGTVYRNGRADEITVDRDACGYRLPTSVEWEYAARGGIASKGHVYSGSDDLDIVGWYRSNSNEKGMGGEAILGVQPVGMKNPNELGLHDMSGNVWEWCYDWDPEYAGLLRVRRGGSWRNFAAYCRVGSSYKNGPKFGSPTIGFRLCQSAKGRGTTEHCCPK